jgi:hypothetical protein
LLFAFERNGGSLYASFTMSEPAFVVQTFREVDSLLVSDVPHEFARMKDALALATRLTPLKAGVVGYSRTGDPAADPYGKFHVFYEAGRIPWSLISHPVKRSRPCAASHVNGASPGRPS